MLSRKRRTEGGQTSDGGLDIVRFLFLLQARTGLLLFDPTRSETRA